MRSRISKQQLLQIKDSENPNLQEFIEKQLFTKGKGKEGFDKFKADFYARYYELNGEPHLGLDMDGIDVTNPDQHHSDVVIKQRIGELISAQNDNVIEQFLQAYSQDVISPLDWIPMFGIPFDPMSITIKEASNKKFNVVREPNGELVLTITYDEFPIYASASQQAEKLGAIPGPVVATYLMKDNDGQLGFELQHIDCDNPELRRMYLGELLSLEDIQQYAVLPSIIEEESDLGANSAGDFEAGAIARTENALLLEDYDELDDVQLTEEDMKLAVAHVVQDYLNDIQSALRNKDYQRVLEAFYSFALFTNEACTVFGIEKSDVAIRDLFDAINERINLSFDEKLLNQVVSLDFAMTGLFSGTANKNGDTDKDSNIFQYVRAASAGKTAFLMGINYQDPGIEVSDRKVRPLVRALYNPLDNDSIDVNPESSKAIANQDYAHKLQGQTEYFKQRKLLQHDVEQMQEDALIRQPVIDVLQESDRLKRNPGEKATTKELTAVLRDTRSLLNRPDGNRVKQYKKLAAKTQKRSWGKILGGAMLMVAGVALMGLSIAALVLTSGGSTPLSALGITIGASLAFGLSIGGIGVGLAGGAGGVALFKSGLKKKPLREKMEDVADEADRERRGRRR